MDKKKKERLLYSVFIVLTVVFFMYVLFPSETVKNYITHKVTEVKPDIEITIGKVKPVFPSGLKFNSVTVYHKSVQKFYASKIRITPGYLSLFVLKPSVAVKAWSYDGVVKGKVFFAKGESGREITVDAYLDDIKLNEIMVKDSKMSATVNGKVSYSGEKGDDAVESELILSECSVDLSSLLSSKIPIKIAELKKLTFKKIEIKAAADLKKLELKQCELKGEQADISIKGDVRIRRPIGRSRLKFTGTVTPHPLFIDNLKKSIPFNFLGSMAGKDGIAFRIDGTVDMPKFSLK